MTRPCGPCIATIAGYLRHTCCFFLIKGRVIYCQVGGWGARYIKVCVWGGRIFDDLLGGGVGNKSSLKQEGGHIF